MYCRDASFGTGVARTAIAQRRCIARDYGSVPAAARPIRQIFELERNAERRNRQRPGDADVHVITAAFTQRIAAVSGRRQRLPLLHALAVLHHERAGGQMRVVAELAVAMVDGDVVSKGVMPMILLKSEIVRVSDPGFHRYYAVSRTRRDIEGVHAVAPMRER